MDESHKDDFKKKSDLQNTYVWCHLDEVKNVEKNSIL